MPANAPPSPDAVLLIGHGTREEQGVEEFHQLTALVSAQMPQIHVAAAFLELASPDIPSQFAALAARGARRVAVAPLLLFAAGHANEDIPQAIAAAASLWPQMQCEQIPHLGCHPLLLELSRLRFEECLSQADSNRASLSETMLVMVGRGSHEAQANSQMARFSRLRWEASGVGWCETAFTAMAAPSLERLLTVATRFPVERIVVQPHLLFRGRLLDRIATQIAAAAAADPDREYLITSHLGPHPLLAATVVDRITGGMGGL